MQTFLIHLNLITLTWEHTFDHVNSHRRNIINIENGKSICDDFCNEYIFWIVQSQWSESGVQKFLDWDDPPTHFRANKVTSWNCQGRLWKNWNWESCDDDVGSFLLWQISQGYFQYSCFCRRMICFTLSWSISFILFRVSDICLLNEKDIFYLFENINAIFTIFGGISISQAIKRSVKKIWTQSHCNKDAVAEILVGVEYWMRSQTFTDIYRREVASNLELILLGKVDHMTLNWVSTSQF